MKRGGAAAGHLLLPMLQPHSLTALILYMPVTAVIYDGSPFYRENAPVGAPRAGDDPAPGTTELLRGGGWVAKERSET